MRLRVVQALLWAVSCCFIHAACRDFKALRGGALSLTRVRAQKRNLDPFDLTSIDTSKNRRNSVGTLLVLSNDSQPYESN